MMRMGAATLYPQGKAVPGRDGGPGRSVLLHPEQAGHGLIPQIVI